MTSPGEGKEKFYGVLRRMLKTPPQPHEPKSKTQKPAKKKPAK
jgi:hypothetical protein